jgi:hypothetical protein
VIFYMLLLILLIKKIQTFNSIYYFIFYLNVILFALFNLNYIYAVVCASYTVVSINNASLVSENYFISLFKQVHQCVFGLALPFSSVVS